MAEAELKVVINDVELEFEGEFEDVLKFYNVIKKDFLEKKPEKKAQED